MHRGPRPNPSSDAGHGYHESARQWGGHDSSRQTKKKRHGLTARVGQETDLFRSKLTSAGRYGSYSYNKIGVGLGAVRNGGGGGGGGRGGGGGGGGKGGGGPGSANDVSLARSGTNLNDNFTFDPYSSPTATSTSDDLRHCGGGRAPAFSPYSSSSGAGSGKGSGSSVKADGDIQAARASPRPPSDERNAFQAPYPVSSAARAPPVRQVADPAGAAAMFRSLVPRGPSVQGEKQEPESSRRRDCGHTRKTYGQRLMGLSEVAFGQDLWREEVEEPRGFSLSVLGKESSRTVKKGEGMLAKSPKRNQHPRGKAGAGKAAKRAGKTVVGPRVEVGGGTIDLVSEEEESHERRHGSQDSGPRVPAETGRGEETALSLGDPTFTAEVVFRGEASADWLEGSEGLTEGPDGAVALGPVWDARPLFGCCIAVSLREKRIRLAWGPRNVPAPALHGELSIPFRNLSAFHAYGPLAELNDCYLLLLAESKPVGKGSGKTARAGGQALPEDKHRLYVLQLDPMSTGTSMHQPEARARHENQASLRALFRRVEEQGSSHSLAAFRFFPHPKDWARPEVTSMIARIHEAQGTNSAAELLTGVREGLQEGSGAEGLGEGRGGGEAVEKKAWLRRSTRRSTRDSAKAGLYEHLGAGGGPLVGEEEARLLFKFPLHPEAPDRVALTSLDRVRLEEGEFLNDNVIDFHFKWLVHCGVGCVEDVGLADEKRKGLRDVHIFSTHFYSKLTETSSITRAIKRSSLYFKSATQKKGSKDKMKEDGSTMGKEQIVATGKTQGTEWAGEKDIHTPMSEVRAPRDEDDRDDIELLKKAGPQGRVEKEAATEEGWDPLLAFSFSPNSPSPVTKAPTRQEIQAKERQRREEEKYEAAHSLVQRWTKNVDLFSKKMVLVPINEALHWSLAVLCNLDQVQSLVDPATEPLTADDEGKAPIETPVHKKSKRKRLRKSATMEGENASWLKEEHLDRWGEGEGGDRVVDVGVQESQEPGDPPVVVSLGRKKKKWLSTRPQSAADSGSGLLVEARAAGGRQGEHVVGRESKDQTKHGAMDVGEPWSGDSSQSKEEKEGDRCPQEEGDSLDLTIGDVLAADGLGVGSKESSHEMEEKPETGGKSARWEGRRGSGEEQGLDGGRDGKTDVKDGRKDVVDVGSRPCLVFMDSLSAHRADKIHTALLNYLKVEWKRRKAPGDGLSPFLSKETFPVIKPRVPTQDNSCDCGVFILKYGEMMLADVLPTLARWTKRALACRLRDFIRADVFSQEDVDGLRKTLQARFQELEVKYGEQGEKGEGTGKVIKKEEMITGKEEEREMEELGELDIKTGDGKDANGGEDREESYDNGQDHASVEMQWSPERCVEAKGEEGGVDDEEDGDDDETVEDAYAPRRIDANLSTTAEHPASPPRSSPSSLSGTPVISSDTWSNERMLTSKEERSIGNGAGSQNPSPSSISSQRARMAPSASVAAAVDYNEEGSVTLGTVKISPGEAESMSVFQVDGEDVKDEEVEAEEKKLLDFQIFGAKSPDELRKLKNMRKRRKRNEKKRAARIEAAALQSPLQRAKARAEQGTLEGVQGNELWKIHGDDEAFVDLSSSLSA